MEQKTFEKKKYEYNVRIFNNLQFSNMSPHYEDDAGSDQGILDNKGIEKRRAFQESVAEDVVVVLRTGLKDPLGLGDPIPDDIAGLM